MSHKKNKTMKTILTLVISLFIGHSITFAQEEMDEMEQQHKTEIFLEQNLMDFNAKYHSAFIAAYQNFENILGEKEQKKDHVAYKSSIDFTAGKNETIHLGDKSSQFFFHFDCQQDELIARAMYEEIIKRILTVSPKGFKKSTEKMSGNDYTTIQFNPKEANKSGHQPTTTVELYFEELIVQVTIFTPKQ